MNKRILYTIAIAVVAIVVAALGYKQYSSYRFNTIVDDLNEQKISGTEGYINVSNSINNLGAYLSSAGNSLTPSTLQSSELKNKVAQTREYVDSACSKKEKDVTGDKLNTETSYLWLDTNQKRYIKDSKTALNKLEKTEFSNAGICSDGKLVLAFYENFADLYSGLIVAGQINSQSTPPTAQQLNSLKEYTTKTSFTDEGILQERLPSTVQFLNTTTNLLADLYYALNAQQNGQTDVINKYSSEIETLSKRSDTDFRGVDKEISGFDKETNTNGATLANQEIDLIDYQNHQDSNFVSKLDYSIPVFWIVDSKVGLFSSQHNEAYPAANNLKDLLAILKDPSLNSLAHKGLLKNVTYTVLGKDHSGYSITARLSNGKILVDKSSPN